MGIAFHAFALSDVMAFQLPVQPHPPEEPCNAYGCTDVTALPASGVVAETMVALVLASEALRKFGGDSLDEFVRNHAAYVASLR